MIRQNNGKAKIQPSPLGMVGHGIVKVFKSDGTLKQEVEFGNLISAVGDQYYGERAAGIASPPDQVTGMQLGTSTTAEGKDDSDTGTARATLGGFIANSGQEIVNGYPTSTTEGSKRRISWRAFWDAGEATNETINEVVLVNSAVGTLEGTEAVLAEVIARAVFESTVDKGSDETMQITWHHDLEGQSAGS